MARTGKKRAIEAITELPDREDFMAFAEANPQAGDPETEGYPAPEDSEDEQPVSATEVEAAAAPKSSAKYVNESGRLYIGRQFTSVEDFEEWLDAQDIGTLPYNAVVDHHTYRPSQGQWVGLQHVHNLRAYYRDVNKWPDGRMPHLFVHVRSNGTVEINVATHPAHDGIHAKYGNHRTIGIEAVWDGEAAPFSDRMVELLRRLHIVLARRRGGALKRVARWADGPSTWIGFQIHRYVPGNSTSCFGSRNMSPESFYARTLKDTAEPEPKPGPTPPGAIYVRTETALPANKAIFKTSSLDAAKEEQERLRRDHGIETVIDSPKAQAR